MSERVLHEEVDQENNRHWITSAGWYCVHAEGANEPRDLVRSDYLARLAARVAELEGEVAKLRACVAAATKIRKFRMPESVNDLRNGAVHDEWSKLTRDYDAARAEVDK